MKLVGRISSVFAIADIGDVIVTDHIILGDFSFNSISSGTALELRNRQGIKKCVHIKSAELTLREGKDNLSFILIEKINKNELRAFEEVWCNTSLEQPL